MISRRKLLASLGLAGAGLGTLLNPRRARAAGDANDGIVHTPGKRTAQGYVPVRTPPVRTLPYRLKDGIKEFHLVAEEFEHEFAPGCKARCWGYNGSTPGPTIEAVEGDRVRMLVSNHLKEPTTIHWHGILLPAGMDGVAGLNQPAIQPGETYAYEFTLRQAGTHMYHPHADEMVQMAFGMMGFFVIHPGDGEALAIDRDYCLMLHNWALHPGTYRPDPAVMLEFDLWSINSKVFPATAPLIAGLNERVRIRLGNLSMWNHPMHLHGHRFHVTGSDGDRWPQSLWLPEATHIVGVGQTRDLEFVADNPGDWAFHCHMAHHTMNPMGHALPNPVGVDTRGVEVRMRSLLPGYMGMGANGMSDMSAMAGMMPGPENTLPMMSGEGPFGPIGMGGMFTVLKVREGLTADDYRDPGSYRHPPGTVARKIAYDPQRAVRGGTGTMDHGAPERKPGPRER
jgi:FtsP/CotA-like multicopper oxidase with cupredoxin domain